MAEKFHMFIDQLLPTNANLSFFVDFKKVAANVDSIKMKLNQLNYLIGQPDMDRAVHLLWEENPNAFSILDILVAVRTCNKAKVIHSSGNIRNLSDYFHSANDVIEFLNGTGLTHILQDKQITNLVDYVFGIEVGLDSNARKNRSGHLMEMIVGNILSKNGIPFRKEIYSSDLPIIAKELGKDLKRFDFVIEATGKTYLIEVNFYADGGSKLNEVARSYSELAPKINKFPEFEFIWITDGVGWKSAKNKLQEAFQVIPGIYNLTTINDFITTLRNNLPK